MRTTPFVARLLALVARYQPIRKWLLRLAVGFRENQSQHLHAAVFEMPEVTPLDVRCIAEVPHAPRINLLVPALSQQHLFGGIQTALQVFDALRVNFSSARIILTDESTPEPVAGAYYSGWPVLQLEQTVLSGENHIVAAGDRWSKTLAIGSHDFFMATAWWTAHLSNAILEVQAQHFSLRQQRRLVYLVQDYEPGFYPWSSRFALAQATYSLPHPTVAIINSHWLKDYLQQQGHSFECQHILSPQMHAGLARARSARKGFKKKRQLLIYGRPGTERNAFSIIVAALRQWVDQYPDAARWRILSAGEPFPAIELGNGCQLSSVGKLKIDDYANMLSETAVGVSLMISPHPSYPPLEMAAFGVRTITNRFANKDLATVSTFLQSIEQVSPAPLARALLGATKVFDNQHSDEHYVDKQHIDWSDNYLENTEPSWPWSTTVAEQLLELTE